MAIGSPESCTSGEDWLILRIALSNFTGFVGYSALIKSNFKGNKNTYFFRAIFSPNRYLFVAKLFASFKSKVKVNKIS